MQAPFDGVPACVIYGEETESLPPQKKKNPTLVIGKALCA
jgi:hypothetical protein